MSSLVPSQMAAVFTQEILEPPFIPPRVGAPAEFQLVLSVRQKPVSVELVPSAVRCTDLPPGSSDTLQGDLDGLLIRPWNVCPLVGENDAVPGAPTYIARRRVAQNDRAVVEVLQPHMEVAHPGPQEGGLAVEDEAQFAEDRLGRAVIDELLLCREDEG